MDCEAWLLEGTQPTRHQHRQDMWAGFSVKKRQTGSSTPHVQWQLHVCIEGPNEDFSMQKFTALRGRPNVPRRPIGHLGHGHSGGLGP